MNSTNYGEDTLYLIASASFITQCYSSMYTGDYAEIGIYYNNEYEPFTNSYSLFSFPNYFFGIYPIYEQPH